MNFFPSVKWYIKVFFILFEVFIFMNLSINDNNFKVKLALTPNQIQNGMMGKNFNEEYNGLYFIMPYKGEQSFWMRDCLVPMDIIMIDGNVITTIHENCEPCDELDCESYKGYGDKVLEIAGGTCERLGIKKGDIVSFSLL